MNNAVENMTDILHSSGLFVVVEDAAEATSDTTEMTFPEEFYDYFEVAAA